MVCALFVSMLFFAHALQEHTTSVEVGFDGSLSHGLVTEAEKSPTTYPGGTSLAEKSTIDGGSIDDAKWALAVLKGLPDVQEILRDGSLEAKILGNKHGPDWELFLDALHAKDSCTAEEVVSIDRDKEQRAITIGQGVYGVIYRRKVQGEILKIPIIGGGYDPITEVEGILEKALTKTLGTCPNSVSLADDRPVCLETGRHPSGQSPFKMCTPMFFLTFVLIFG